MVRGLYAAASGMMVRMSEQDVLANNLANAATPGFRRDLPIAASFPEALALEGAGFFTVLSQGRYVYTRAGNFTLNKAGLLVTTSGDPVLGERGFIQLPESAQIHVNPKGVILVDGKEVDRLLIVNPPDPSALLRTPGGFVSPEGIPTPAADTTVHQGRIEHSNVNPIKEMTAMILAFRIYEANQRALQAQDQTLDKAINDIGRV